MAAAATYTVTAVVDKLRHNYVRLAALQSQLLADLPASSQAEAPQQQSALKHFIGCTTQGQQYLDRLSQQRPFSNGKYKNGQQAAPSSSSSLFLRQLQQEVERLRRFIHSSAEDLWMRLLAAADGLSKLQQTALRLQSQSQQQECLLQHQELATECDHIGDDLVSIDSFVQHNATACAYLASLSDTLNSSTPPSLAQQGPSGTLPTLEQLLNGSNTKAKVPAAYKTCLSECILGTTDFDAVLIGLSDLYEQVRFIAKQLSADLSHGPAAHLDKGESAWVAPDWFSRSTTKYWVQPQHRMRIKCEIIKNLPVSIYGGQRRKLAAGDSEDALKFLQQQQVKDSTLVSSVYLDDPDFHTYRSRLRREDGASVVRLRWYGARSLKPDQKIYVEKKVHREPWTEEPGYKERCGVEQQHIEPFLEGRGGPPIMATNDPQGTFLKDTQQWITEEEQAPVLRTLCNRAAFQESSTNEVRISLDSQLHMIREGAASPKQPGDWCRDLGAMLGSGDVTHFQHDVAEVKLSIRERPAWLESLTASGLLLRVPKFSKYLHGVTSLYPNRVDSIPYWFLPADKEGYVMTPATWEEMADPNDPYLKDAASWLFPSTEASQAGPPSMPKSQQLVQRFNQAFSRKKGTTATSSSSDLPLSTRQPEIHTGGAKGTEDQGRAVWDGRARPGQHPGLLMSGAVGTDTAHREGHFLAASQGGPASQQEGYMQGARAGNRAELGNSPSAAPRQPLKLKTLPQQPYTTPEAALALSNQRSPSVRQSPFSQVGCSSQPLVHASSASSAVDSEPQFGPSFTASQAMQGRKGSSQLSPDPGFNIQPSSDQSGALLHTQSQGRALSTQGSAPAGGAEGNDPAAWSSTHILPAVPTPDREEEQKDRGALRDPSLPNWPYSRPFGAVLEEQHAGYVPGMYDGLAEASTSATTQLPQQQQQQHQQQQVTFQSQDQQQWSQQQQQQPQLQQQLSIRGNSRDYMVDMQALNAVPESSRQTAQHTQRAQRELGRPSGSPGQGFPQVAQQVPFYESSPQYLPTTLALKPPISARVSSLFTGLLRGHNQPADVESGMQPTSKSAVPAQNTQDAPQPAGCSPKSALFRSRIFQNPRAADQDRPMSPEQAERRARGLVRTRVEPKVFFANERTFLQWLQISVLLMFTGLSLLGGSSVTSLGGSGEATATCDTTACKASKYAGVIISPIAILFMVYALFMYKRRTVQILRRANVRYDDQSGPVMLVILLIAATLASLVLTAYATLG